MPKAQRHAGRLAWLLPLGLALLVGCLAVSGESFWIDEADSAFWAMQPGLAQWAAALQKIPSDVQMGGYGLQLWGWEKVAGASEWGLRLNNVIWLAVSLGAWAAAMPRRGRGAALLLVSLSPFVWYYTNEIRPYAMVFAGMSMVAGGLVRCVAGEVTKGWLWAMGIGGVLAMGATSAAIPWVAASFAAVCWKGRAALKRLSWAGMAALALAGLMILGVDGWSFLHAGRVASPEGSSAGSLLFALYELFGFAGLGPGRAELRTALAATLPGYAPGLLLLAGALAAVAMAGGKEFLSRVGLRAALAWAGLFALPAVAVVALALHSGLRVTGRHLTPMLPLALPLLVAGTDRLWRGGKLWGRVAVAGLLLGWGVSCVELRWAERHRKDDYRQAAAMAREALREGKQVWWAADCNAALYYQLPLATNGSEGGARFWMNEESLPPERPDLVFRTRADVYDRPHTLAGMLAREGFARVRTMQGFEVWQRQ